jgi:uncharacterized protein YdeI (YjbR/CyaY-like superfamily)
MNPEVDLYISKVKKWQDELEKLRAIVLDCQLTEELKWRVPCYTYKNGNVVLINSFKDFCTLSFFKGALLNDTNNVLIKQGENTQSARIIRFTSVNEIIEMEAIIKTYIYEAIEVEKAGLKVELNNKELEFPEELLIKLNENPEFKIAFEALTPGRQRAYNLFFSDSKQSKTREARIEKYEQRILNGKGINDCVCGLSKKMPSCDGSHKFIESKK